MRKLGLLLWLWSSALLAQADVQVEGVGDRLNLKAVAVPVSQVLDLLAERTGMTVVYEQTPPRQPVTIVIEGRTPAEAVLLVLQGLGLNYALRADPNGRALTLLMAGEATAGTQSSRPQASGPTIQPTELQEVPDRPRRSRRDREPAEPSDNSEQRPAATAPAPGSSPIAVTPLGSGFSSPLNSPGFSSPTVPLGNPANPEKSKNR